MANKDKGGKKEAKKPPKAKKDKAKPMDEGPNPDRDAIHDPEELNEDEE